MTNVTIHGQDIPTTVIPMTEEPITFVTVEYGGRPFRFSVRGTQEPYEVSYRHDFPEWDPVTGEERYAWFPIAGGEASRGVLIQQYVYPQLIELHRAAQAVDPFTRSA